MISLVCHSRERKIDDSEKPLRGAVIPGLISCWINRPFRILVVSDIVEAVGSDLPFIVMPYITKWVIGEARMSSGLSFSILAGINLGSRLITIPLWLYMTRIFGKVKV